MEFRKIYLSNPVCNRSGVKLSETMGKDHLVTCGIPYANTYGIPRNFTAKNTAEFCEIPWHSVCFSKNSVFHRKSKTHFRGHPKPSSKEDAPTVTWVSFQTHSMIIIQEKNENTEAYPTMRSQKDDRDDGR
jgi:hypothetical protein